MENARDALQPVVFGRTRTICCHSATLSHRFPPNSLEAVAECLAASVPRLELDVQFCADDSLAVFHDAVLDRTTSGTGRVSGLTRRGIREARYLNAEASAVCFLEEVVRLMRVTDCVLQVDLKAWEPLGARRTEILAAALRPLEGRVIIGTQAHWNLRALAGEFRIAFDPWREWHYAPDRAEPELPRILGVHGLWDDTGLAQCEIPAADYLEVRMADALGLLPQAREWMVEFGTILHLARLGFDLSGWLGRRGVSLTAWTLREGTPDRPATLRRLFELGVETVITDVPLMLGRDAEGLDIRSSADGAL